MHVKLHANVLRDRNIALGPSMSNNSNYANTDNKEHAADKIKRAKSKKVGEYVLGVLLLEFSVDRGLISLSKGLSFNDLYAAKQKKGKYYLPTNYNAICNFDISDPSDQTQSTNGMVCSPLPWSPINEKSLSISDLRGGYSSNPTGGIYNRFRLINSRNLSHFHIVLDKDSTQLVGQSQRSFRLANQRRTTTVLTYQYRRCTNQ